MAFCLSLVLLGAARSGSAHHSGAMFDRTRVIDITGVVKEFLWTNPHSSFKVEVPGVDGGAAQLWFIEMNATSNLVHDGWKKTTIKPGDQVTVTINPLRDGRPGGWFLAITLPNGAKLGTVPSAPAEGAAP